MNELEPDKSPVFELANHLNHPPPFVGFHLILTFQGVTCYRLEWRSHDSEAVTISQQNPAFQQLWDTLSASQRQVTEGPGGLKSSWKMDTFSKDDGPDSNEVSDGLVFF